MRQAIVYAGLALSLSGCSPVTAILGAGAGQVVERELESIETHTFAHPIDLVRAATLSSVMRMGMEVSELDALGDDQHIIALAREQTARIDLERVTPEATRVRVIVHDGPNLDQATADSIIDETSAILSRRDT